MVKHFCDHCDAACKPMDMSVVRAVRGRRSLAMTNYDASADEMYSELCADCAIQLQVWLRVTPELSKEPA